MLYFVGERKEKPPSLRCEPFPYAEEGMALSESKVKGREKESDESDKHRQAALAKFRPLKLSHN